MAIGSFKKSIYVSILLVSLVQATALSQTRTLKPVKVSAAPVIDGSLNDSAWMNVPVAADFVASSPVFGGPASQRTVVKVIYDNDAVYVGAYMFDDPGLIRKQFTARDGETDNDVDYFSVSFDTYNDRQNGFQFLVTAVNVQTDARLRLDPSLGGTGSYVDKAWDAVWESKVSTKTDGWVVEMKIPFFSLRFPKDDVQTWGLQFLRLIRRSNEICTWSPLDPGISGFVNQFGILEELRNLNPPLRLSFSPYLSGGFRSTPEKNGYLVQRLTNGGMDLKYGITESFTLDATLVPDFGQVVSDNVVNNLTPYEIQFEENRPFFTEGVELFNKAGLFYSRRIGSIPEGYFDVQEFVNANSDFEVIRNPARSQLYNALRISGRTRKKLGIGVFNAITAPMNAKIRNDITGKDSSIQTSPLTNYNVFVLDQVLGGRSYLTFTNTNVLRDQHNRNSNVSGLDISLFDGESIHQFNGSFRYSSLWGRSKYDGFSSSLRYAKVSGLHLYHVQQDIMSRGYDPNDLGILDRPDFVGYQLGYAYDQKTRTEKLNSYNLSFYGRLQYMYSTYVFNTLDLMVASSWEFLNFWKFALSVSLNPVANHDYFELRTPERFLSIPAEYGIGIDGNTDSRKKLLFKYGFRYNRSQRYDNNITELDLGLRYRFGNRFSLELEALSGNESNQLGYAFLREDNGEPIAALRSNHSFSTTLSGIYNFTSRLNITFRSRHYWNDVKYKQFSNVDAAGKLIDRPFIAGRNQNVNIFNTDLFLTWDFQLGSRVVLSYKNWLGDDEIVVVPFYRANTYFHNLTEQFGLRHGNELSIRFIYFLDYNKLRK